MDSLSSNSMKSRNPHSGFHKETTAKTIDTNPNPACNQGGDIVVQLVVLNDQGRSVMDVSDRAGCLRAQEHGHQPVVAYPIENHPMDSRVTLQAPDEPCQTLTSRMGTGGGGMCQ